MLRIAVHCSDPPRVHTGDPKRNETPNKKTESIIEAFPGIATTPEYDEIRFAV
jgi:hypothetical protein